jgi:hypothetical protein
MKNRLDQAAAESGRSQSQEAEIRLESSFYSEDMLGWVLERLACGKINPLLAEVLVRTVGRADAESRRRGRPDWLDDRDEHEIPARTLAQIVRFVIPAGALALSEEELTARVAACNAAFETDLILEVAAHQGGPRAHAAAFLRGYQPPPEAWPEWREGDPEELPPGRRVAFRAITPPEEAGEDDKPAAPPEPPK